MCSEKIELYNRNSKVEQPYDVDLPEDLPKTVIIGAGGFLGLAFLASYRRIHPDCLGTARKQEGLDILLLDLSSPNIAPFKLSKRGHKDALILAGITKINECETNKELAYKVNVTGTLELIRQLFSEGIKPIFASSDYVFDGASGGYWDDSPVYPIVEYGRQKAEVEASLPGVTKGKYLVIRLSKIFSLRKGDGTLLDEMANILSSGGTLQLAYDQIFCPTLITDLVNAVANLQAKAITGVINVCSPQVWSRYELGLEMSKALGIDSNRVRRISLDELGVGSKRPKNTSMQIKRLLREVSFSFTPMAKCIEQVAGNWRV